MKTYKVWLKSSEFYEIEADDAIEALDKALCGLRPYRTREILDTEVFLEDGKPEDE